MAQPFPIKQTSLIPLSTNLKSKISLVWAKTASTLYERLSFNVLREICQFLAFRPLLVESRNFEFVIFDPAEEKLQSIPFHQFGLSLSDPWSCEIVCIGDYQLFMCGGCIWTVQKVKVSSTTMLVNNGQPIQLEDMDRGRFLHGLYYDEIHRSIFAFGGKLKSMSDTSSCEEYNIARNSWLPLSNMTTPSICSRPCGYRGKVYIGIPNAEHCEVFTIETRRFAKLRVPMCQSFTLPIVWRGQLILFQRKKVRRLNVHTYEFIAESELPESIYSRTSLMFNNRIFNLLNDECVEYSLETMKKKTRYSLNK